MIDIFVWSQQIYKYIEIPCGHDAKASLCLSLAHDETGKALPSFPKSKAEPAIFERESASRLRAKHASGRLTRSKIGVGLLIN